ncbi:uncharacterized protein V2V93DRAFT_326909 [Kockiozyma suomiensis]|uniref:uncharacterized protein n=1 Tax=Kockiozyma suomiensis TaxID=1337062 RepID=UPI0033442CA1
MSSLKYPYLISRVVDPLFGIFVGVSAFYLYERREDREPGHTLYDLAIRRYNLETAKFGGDVKTVDERLSEREKQKRDAEAAVFENCAK